MSVGKYSPTISHRYDQDQGWWEKNGGGDNGYDNDGYDGYGYDRAGRDRAGNTEDDYLLTVAVDPDGTVHHTLYEQAWARYLSEEPARKPARDDVLYVLRQIINDLPVQRDWLDPTLEAAARAMIERLK